MVLPHSSVLPALQVFALVGSALAVPTPMSIGAPIVSLDYGNFQGFNSARDTESFLGIAFAQPPVGQLRFNNPVSPLPFSGVRNATWFGNSCYQQPALAPGESLPDSPGLHNLLDYLTELQPHSIVNNTSEDCLYINVVRPAGVTTGANLPVIIWVHGGAFENGDASGYNGTQIVSRSLDLKSPVIYVSFNYRMNAFGFLGGKEVKAAGLGNFGLYDQRLALQWIQKYIYLFGGSPREVILWGQSAGATSAMLHMVAFDGRLDGLFHGAVMESGSAHPLHEISLGKAQDNYDFLLEQTNCTSASDTLDCLRQAPYEAITNAVLQTQPLLDYQGLNTTWMPMVDGILLKQSVREALQQGKYAQVPAILGNVDDEGTLFSLFSLNVTTDAQFLEYIQTVFLVGVPENDIEIAREVYPDNPALGSPYGINDTISPQYKRISSFQGDFYFHVPRRYALRYLSRTQDTWSYLWRRDKDTPGVGSFHESDLQEFYDLTGECDWVGTDMLINFGYTLNPNVPPNGYPSGAAPSLLSNISWPTYHQFSLQLLTFDDPDVLTFTNDTFRAEAIAFLDEMQHKMGL